MQMLPAIARGDANKVWIVPSELNDALKGLGSAVGSVASAIPALAKGEFHAPAKIDVQEEIRLQDAEDEASDRTVEEAIAGRPGAGGAGAPQGQAVGCRTARRLGRA